MFCHINSLVYFFNCVKSSHPIGLSICYFKKKKHEFPPCAFKIYYVFNIDFVFSLTVREGKHFLVY